MYARFLGNGLCVALCLALFTKAIAAGNRGFLAIGDWLNSYRDELPPAIQAPEG
ncbi:MAG: hypothetical protein F6K49_49190 [Moorea sp. SIO3I6]|nr:hypothetical protein [Moorena sp. SIO3I6]